MNKSRVLMLGPGRDVKGGISTVVNNYFALGLDKNIDLFYLPTMEDGIKIKKLAVAGNAYIKFCGLLDNYDIIHFHMAAQSSFDRKARFIQRANKAGKKIIIHQHAADFDKYYFEQVNNNKRKKIKEIFDMAIKVIVLSEKWAEFFGNNICAPLKIEILHNGVIIPDYIKEDYSNHNVLMLGQLCERKGTSDLLKAIPIVLKTIPDAVFYLAGDGDIEKYRKIALENGLDSNVKFPGWVKDVEKEKLLKKCGTFILPSYAEGMPMSVLEAMSYGLATISTNAGGIPQIIEQNISGLRIEAGNIDEIAITLIDILLHEEKRRALGLAGRNRIKNEFDLEKNIVKLEEIYKVLI